MYCRAVAVFASLLSLPACTGTENFVDQLSREWDALIIVMTGGSSPLAQKKLLGARKLHENSPDAVRLARENAELLHEIYQVVFGQEPQSRSEFGSLVDTLNQGASLEGVYNGLTHSSQYRSFEKAHPGANPAALAFFASELAETELLLREVTPLNESSALPLAPPVPPGERAVTEESQSSSVVLQHPRESKTELERRYLSLFQQASIFTLKRVLADEALRLMAEKQKARQLGVWYGDWVARMCELNVDFGLKQRNQADATFHREWIKGTTQDRVQWEVLNRLHRILNAKNSEGERKNR